MSEGIMPDVNHDTADALADEEWLHDWGSYTRLHDEYCILEVALDMCEAERDRYKADAAELLHALTTLVNRLTIDGDAVDINVVLDMCETVIKEVRDG
jgi:hypothetical protein